MRIHISPSDGVPIYLQIVQQVRRLIAGGELVPGEEMPSIRTLAERLVVNPNTVARAYRELEAAGVVTSSRGLGTYVSPADMRLAEAEKRQMLSDRIDVLLLESRQMGISTPEVMELLRERDARLPGKDGETSEEVVRG